MPVLGMRQVDRYVAEGGDRPFAVRALKLLEYERSFPGEPPLLTLSEVPGEVLDVYELPEGLKCAEHVEDNRPELLIFFTETRDGTIRLHRMTDVEEPLRRMSELWLLDSGYSRLVGIVPSPSLVRNVEQVLERLPRIVATPRSGPYVVLGRSIVDNYALSGAHALLVARLTDFVNSTADDPPLRPSTYFRRVRGYSAWGPHLAVAPVYRARLDRGSHSAWVYFSLDQFAGEMRIIAVTDRTRPLRGR